jgi:site-specific DNA-methyltransferase (cytosine-N4-specific)
MMRTPALYSTPLGAAYRGDSRDLLDQLENDSVDLVLTSPPFALLREKSYGNKEQAEYVQWLSTFAARVYRVLTPTGSFVLDLGGAYQRGLPVRSLYQWRIVLSFCDDLGFHLAEDFYWHNPSKLPSPIEWVNKRKIRAKDTVNTLWWFSKTPWPQADVREVLTEYSPRMRKLLQNAEAFYTPKDRPSGHDISLGFDRDNGGALPSNLLQIPNTESNSRYLRSCKAVDAAPHPARFPAKLPEFFIRLLTKPGDLVLDIFAGSNTTGEVAERLGRRWLAFEESQVYLATSVFRFVEDQAEAVACYQAIKAGESVALDGQLRLV